MSRQQRIQGKQDKRNHSEDHRSHHIEGQMDHCRSLGGSGTADTRYHGRYTGTDILSQRNENRRVCCNHTVHRQSL